jgi:hypothetical protein
VGNWLVEKQDPEVRMQQKFIIRKPPISDGEENDDADSNPDISSTDPPLGITGLGP